LDSRRSPARLALIAPPALYLFVFLAIPMGLMGLLSFRPALRGGIANFDWTPTLEHYRATFAEGGYTRLLWLSVGVALVVALITTALAYPVAYFLAFRAGRRAPLLLTLLIIPFWTSYLLRLIAWKIILGTNGAINSFFLWTGVIEEPVGLLLYSRTAVVVTLVYVWLPFVALPIYASLLRIDRSVLEAAGDLGARPWQRLLRVTLPLSAPGVFAAYLMVFIPTVGEYVSPLLVGGSKGSLYGNIIEIFFGDGINWPRGSAMAMIMLAGVMALVLLIARLVNVRRIVEEP